MLSILLEDKETQSLVKAHLSMSPPTRAKGILFSALDHVARYADKCECNPMASLDQGLPSRAGNCLSRRAHHSCCHYEQCGEALTA